MIAKRFKLDDFDSEVEMWELMNTQAEIISDLEKENEQLKDIIKDIVVQLDANHTFHTYQMTIPINKVIYNELKRRLKGTSFNEELRGFLEQL